MLLGNDADKSHRQSAIEILLDPDDAMALQCGILLVVKQGWVEDDEFVQPLKNVCSSPHLGTLTLDLKGAGFTGPVPDVLLEICSCCRLYDLSENDFTITEGSYLQQMVNDVHNIDAVKHVDLDGKLEMTGENTPLTRHN